MREFELIDALRARLSTRRADTRLGIGDDAAILAPPVGYELVVSTDTLIAGRHFPTDTAPFDIGYKSVAVNLSDIAAMGADPAWLTVSLAVPSLSAEWCEALIDGMQAACTDCPTDQAVDIVGGDTTRADTLTLSITALGQVAAGAAVRRDGARIGDVIAVTGTLGDAAAGLALWPSRATASDDERMLIERLTRPALRRGAALAGRAHAALDVSDGLLADLGHILESSQAGAAVNIDALPTSSALSRVITDRSIRRRLQAAGGDDYELCITLPDAALAPLRQALGCALSVIGRIVAAPGLHLHDAAGLPIPAADYAVRGWDHFARQR